MDRMSIMAWTQHQTCLYKIGRPAPMPIPDRPWAMFDFDDTLSPLHSNTVTAWAEATLRHLLETHTVIVFSNQYGITKGHTTHAEVQARFALLPPEVSVFYSTEKDRFRKPMTGMFDLALTLLQDTGDALDPETSFYCGDAAGRPKDFSVSDRYFAHNIGVTFMTPESYPKEDRSPLVKRQDHYGGLLRAQIENQSVLSLPDRQGTGVGQRPLLVILVGPQAAGKSTVARTLCKDKGIDSFVHVSKDLQKTRADKVCLEAVRKRQNIVVDNTNPSIKDRAHYIQLCPDYEVHLYYFEMAKEMSTHLCHMRTQLGGAHIPAVARHIYYKNLQAPSAGEGQVFKIRADLTKVPEFHYMYDLSD